jgi:hypothetical protein
MLCYFTITFALHPLTAGATLRATDTQDAVRGIEAHHRWTNEDLQRLSRVPGLISVVGQRENESSHRAGDPQPPLPAEDPAWYAARSNELNARLESEEADLRISLNCSKMRESAKTRYRP